jgi:hypothetical protein
MAEEPVCSETLARLQAGLALEAVLPHLGRLQRRDEVPEIIDSFLVRGRSSIVLQPAA